MTSLRFLDDSVIIWDRIILLSAQDVSADQWEGVRYRIRESEDEFLSFDCASFEHV